ncbi:hypothetical protein PG995_009842 [Apiospora arundinis]
MYENEDEAPKDSHSSPSSLSNGSSGESGRQMSMEEIARAQETINAVIQSIRSHRPQQQQSPQGDEAQLEHVDEILPMEAKSSMEETSGSTYSQEFHDASPVPQINPLVIRKPSLDSLNSNNPRHLAAAPPPISPRSLTSPEFFPPRPNYMRRTMSDEQMEQSDSELSDIVINASAMTHHDYWARAAESTPTLLSNSSRRLRGRPLSYHSPNSALESPRRRPLSYRETYWDSVNTIDAPPPLQRSMSSYREYNGSRISHSRRTSILRDVYQMHEEEDRDRDRDRNHLQRGDAGRDLHHQRYTPPSSTSSTEKPLHHRHSAVSIDLLEAASQMKKAGYVGQMRRISGSGDSQDGASSSSAPDSIEVGGHTYVRHGSGIDRENAKRRRTLRKRRKGSPEGPDMGIAHEILFFLLIATAQALMLSGVAQAMIPATVIGATFGLSSPADLAWFSAAYALTSGTFVLPAGRLGDLYGHKKIFIIGFAWFAVWSIMVGFAELVQTNTNANGVVYFDICRAMQGIGPALLVPNGQAMLGRAYTPGRRKALVMSLFGAAAPFGFVVGGVMAAMLAEYASWPWAFWVLGIVCAVLALVAVFVLPATEQTKKNDKESMWTQLDVTGMLCGVTGLVLFNFAWNQAPIASWTTPYTYFMLIIGLLLIGVFVYVEKNAVHPLVPVAAMRSQTNFVLACVATGWGGFAIWVFYYIQVVETLRGWSPLLTAASLAPGPVTGLLASLVVAKYMARIGPHWIIIISMCAFAAGSLFMCTAPVGQTYWANTFLSALIMPFGMDTSNPAASLLLSNSVAKEHQGIAASLVVTVVNYSISTALGFAATIEVQMHKNHIGSGGSSNPADVALAGIRAAQYFGLGLGGLGICVALAFFAAAWRTRRKEAAAPPANAVPPSEMRSAPSLQGHSRKH